MSKKINKKLPKYAIGFGGYASKGLAGAGSGLSIGSNPLLMAATGGLSAPIGAALGAGVGLIGASKEDQALELAMQNEKIAGAVAMNKNINDQMQAEYNLKNQTNNRMPGFKKGKPGFKPNAMVSKGEVIKNGYTGSLNPMPGNFDPSNPDPLAVRINKADSVYPSDPRTTLPGWEPQAVLAAKMSKAQVRAQKILLGEIKGGKLDKEEARRTLSTIETQTKNFDKELAINNYGVDQQLPRFRKGKNGYLDVNTQLSNEWLGDEITRRGVNMPKMFGTKRDYGTTYDDENEIREYLGTVRGSNSKLIKGAQVGSPNINQIDYPIGIKDNDISKIPMSGVSEDMPNVDKIEAADIRFINRGGIRSNKASQSSSKALSTKSNTNVLTGNTVPQTASKGPSKLSAKDVANYTAAGWKPQVAIGNSIDVNAAVSQAHDLFKVNTNIDKYLGNEIARSGAAMPAMSGVTEDITYTPSKVTKAAASTGDSFAGMSSSTLGNIGSIASQLAPVVSNLFSGRPETFQPVYESYINPNQRYNIAPYIQESLKQRQIARYNQSTNRGQGGSMAYGANIYAKGQEALSGIMNQADTANMGFAAQYADRFNQASASRANELRRINDLNARSRGASQDIKNAGLTQLSEFAQNQQLMSNQKSKDNMNMEIFGAYASAMDPKMLDQMKQIYAKYQGAA